MENYPKENPEIEPIPQTNPIKPQPEITPGPEKIEPNPVFPETEPLTKPEIEPNKLQH